MNLPLLQGDPTKASTKLPKWQQLKIEREARFERSWFLDATPFPVIPLWQERCLKFLEKHLREEHLVVADLGCGRGDITRFLLELGKEVDAVDIASNALKHLQGLSGPGLRLLKDALPKTKLPDGVYDAVIAFGLIGELEEEEYRLFFSELARIGKKGSLAIVSTPLDVETEGGVERFLSLFATEYDLLEAEFGHIRYQTKWEGLTSFLEKVRKFFLAERGITHIVAVGKRRSLI